MYLYISCKGCTSECPSNVDMSTLKAEFLHQYQKTHGIPLRSKAFAYINSLNELGSRVPAISNFFLGNRSTGKLLKNLLGVAPERTLPQISKMSLRSWYKKYYRKLGRIASPIKTVFLFCDEFTNHNDTDIGIKALKLLHYLGYEVKVVDHAESGRAALSKGLLDRAKDLANKNVQTFKGLISKDSPLIGIEPSAILSFRDEYPRLVNPELVEDAKKLKRNCQLIDEFLVREMLADNIKSGQFTDAKKAIALHGHCHQKSLSSLSFTTKLLSLPKNYSVEVIPSGCCGMAGSFGYEKEHYDVSMKIGELVLFPAVREAGKDTVIAAAGTSCRHQIKDGTDRVSYHPLEVLFEAAGLNTRG